jgi:hypothetical protein
MLENNELDNSLTVIREQKSLFLTNYSPFWSCSSVCGMRPRMEDSCVANGDIKVLRYTDLDADTRLPYRWDW